MTNSFPKRVAADLWGCDRTERRAGNAQGERAEHQVESHKPVRGERPTTRQWPRPSPEQTAVESQQARDAGDEILVEWDNCGERLARRRRAEPQPMLARSVGDDDMASVDSSHVGKQRAQRARIDQIGRAQV